MAHKPLTVIRGPCQFAERRLWHNQLFQGSNHPEPQQEYSPVLSQNLFLFFFWIITTWSYFFSLHPQRIAQTSEESLHISPW